MSQIRRRQIGGGGGSMPVDTRPPQRRYLTFEVTKDGPIEFTINATTAQITSISYSLDNGNTWVETVNPGSSTTVATPKIKKNHVVLFKGTGTTAKEGKLTFNATSARYNIAGNMASLLYDDSFSNKNHEDYFKSLFKNNTSIISAKDIYFGEWPDYESLFNGCSNLKEIPPFRGLASQNYKNWNVLKGTAVEVVKARFTYLFGYTAGQFLYNCTKLKTIYLYIDTVNYTSAINALFSNDLPENGKIYLGGAAWTNKSEFTKIPSSWTFYHVNENWNVIN